jgi:hypothetical protein
MKLRELFDHLAFSELSQLNVVDPNTNFIKEEHYDKVLFSIKLALTALHTRFPLKEETMVLQLQNGVYRYNLHNSYALSTNINGYIVDSETNPYKNTLIKVERILSDSLYEYALNNESETYSIHTPNLSTLDVPADIVDKSVDLPECVKTDKLKLVYRANHYDLPIGFNGYDADKVEVDLPYVYVEALLYYVASRLHNPMGLVNEFNGGNNYAMKYERACAELEKHNVYVDQLNGNARLFRNGWV